MRSEEGQPSPAHGQHGDGGAMRTLRTMSTKSTMSAQAQAGKMQEWGRPRADGERLSCTVLYAGSGCRPGAEQRECL